MCFDNTSRSLVNKHCSLKNKIEGLKNLIFFVLISQIEQDKQENMIKSAFQNSVQGNTIFGCSVCLTLGSRLY
jgi:hypothetical protein